MSAFHWADAMRFQWFLLCKLNGRDCTCWFFAAVIVSVKAGASAHTLILRVVGLRMLDVKKSKMHTVACRPVVVTSAGRAEGRGQRNCNSVGRCSSSLRLGACLGLG